MKVVPKVSSSNVNSIKNSATKPSTGAVAKPKGSGAAAVKKAGPLPKEQLLSLAADLKSGRITEKEAQQRFVAEVVQTSVKNSLGENDLKKLNDSLQELFGGDSSFLKSVATNLKSLT
jgi:butyrate kinase